MSYVLFIYEGNKAHSVITNKHKTRACVLYSYKLYKALLKSDLDYNALIKRLSVLKLSAAPVAQMLNASFMGSILGHVFSETSSVNSLAWHSEIHIKGSTVLFSHFQQQCISIAQKEKPPTPSEFASIAVCIPVQP